MGQVIIELPQNVNRFYQVESVELGEELLQDLDRMERKMKSSKVPPLVPPRRDNLQEDGDAVLGIWSDREEEADEIAHRVREQNRRVT